MLAATVVVVAAVAMPAKTIPWAPVFGVSSALAAQDRGNPLAVSPTAPETAPSPTGATPLADILVYSASAGQLYDRFTRLGYTYDAVVDGGDAVPRVRVQSIPIDIGDMESVDEKKALFFKILLPLVLRENDRILADRQEIQILEAFSGGDADALDRDRRARLDALLDRYRMDEPDFDELLRRADVIPPSLALAQAAIESGWGTSRFAQEGNALFGQITTSSDSLVSRSGDGAQRFAAFGDLSEATASYMRNLNTHRAYEDMRALRADRGASGELVSGADLAEGLLRYSERGADYVAFVQQIIRTNDLHLADGAYLSVTTQLAETPF